MKSALFLASIALVLLHSSSAFVVSSSPSKLVGEFHLSPCSSTYSGVRVVLVSTIQTPVVVAAEMPPMTIKAESVRASMVQGFLTPVLQFSSTKCCVVQQYIEHFCLQQYRRCPQGFVMFLFAPSVVDDLASLLVLLYGIHHLHPHLPLLSQPVSSRGGASNTAPWSCKLHPLPGLSRSRRTELVSCHRMSWSPPYCCTPTKLSSSWLLVISGNVNKNRCLCAQYLFGYNVSTYPTIIYPITSQAGR